MGTRSHIGIEDPQSGKIAVVYCHWDGYPEHNGRILANFYTDPSKVINLISEGNISSLGVEIGEKHNFDEASRLVEHGFPTQTTFYGRDRDEADQEPRIYYSLSGYKKNVASDIFIEFIYIFTKCGWIMYSNCRGGLERISKSDVMLPGETTLPMDVSSDYNLASLIPENA